MFPPGSGYVSSLAEYFYSLDTKLMKQDLHMQTLNLEIRASKHGSAELINKLILK